VRDTLVDVRTNRQDAADFDHMNKAYQKHISTLKKIGIKDEVIKYQGEALHFKNQ
jgi:hypothetical protein